MDDIIVLERKGSLFTKELTNGTSDWPAISEVPIDDDDGEEYVLSIDTEQVLVSLDLRRNK